MSRRAAGDREIVAFCGLMFAVSAFSIDITLPALAQIADRLAAPAAVAPVTVTAYAFAFGVGQIVFGPLSDRRGRKSAVVSGFALYLLGALLCALSPTIETLLLGRALQGFGGAVGHVAGRAVLRDLYSGDELAKRMAAATAIFAFGPIVAAPLGWALAEVGEWRAVFWGTALYGGALLAFAAWRLPETAVPDPRAADWKILSAAARRFAANRQSLFFTLLAGVAMSGMLSFVASAPRLYANFGITGAAFAFLFASHGFGIVVGQAANRRAIAKFGPAMAAAFASAGLALTSLVAMVLALAGWLGPYSLALVMFFTGMSFLSVFANAASLTLDPHGASAGFASSLFGFGAQTLAAVAASLLAAAYDGDVVPWSVGTFAIFASVSVALSLWMRRRDVL